MQVYNTQHLQTPVTIFHENKNLLHLKYFEVAFKIHNIPFLPVVINGIIEKNWEKNW